MNARRRYSLTSLVAALLLMAAGTACVEPFEITPLDEEVEISFRITLPSSELMTKADIAAVNTEASIYDLQIWAFTHGGAADEVAVGYAHKTDGFDPATQTITMKLRSAFVNGTNPKLDFYALANGTSVNFTAAKDKKRSDLQGALISGSDATGFGAAHVSAVPGAGLPMVAYIDNQGNGFDMTFLRYGFTTAQLALFKTDKPGTKPDGFSDAQWAWANTEGNWDYGKVCPALQLQRAIAKIRFVFAKATNMSADAQVVSVALGSGANFENMLPASTYLFPRESGTAIKPDGTTYEAFNWTGANSASLVPASDFTGNTVDTPLRLRKDSDMGTTPPSGMTAQEYENFLTAEITDKHALERILYLRESDRTGVVARINYTIGTGDAAVSGTADIAIPDGEKLSRNTWWTVYAYFISYELGFQVSVMPWDGIGSSPNDNSHMQ